MRHSKVRLLIMGITLIITIISTAIPASGGTNSISVIWESDSSQNTTNVNNFGHASDYYILLKMVNTARSIVSTRTLSGPGSSTTFAAKSDYYYLSVFLISRTIESNCIAISLFNSWCDDYTIVAQKIFGGDDMAGKYFIPPRDESGYFPVAAYVTLSLLSTDLVDVSLGALLYFPYLRISNDFTESGGGGAHDLCPFLAC